MKVVTANVKFEKENSENPRLNTISIFYFDMPACLPLFLTVI